MLGIVTAFKKVVGIVKVVKALDDKVGVGKSNIKPSKGIEAGVVYAVALVLIQKFVPAGVLTPDGQVYVAAAAVGALTVAYNFVKHLFDSEE